MDLNKVDWRKSTRSGGGGGNCVELAVVQEDPIRRIMGEQSS